MARVASRGSLSTPAHTTSTAVAGGIVYAGAGLALLRALSSYSWLQGAFIGKDAKFAPDFLGGAGLSTRITAPKMGFAHTALTPWKAGFLTGTAVPHASLFAWLIALGEVGAGLSLLLGLFARLGGLLAIAQAAVNILVAGNSPGGTETIGHNYMLALAGLVVIVTAAGRAYGLDRLLVARFPTSRPLRLIC